MRRGAVLALLTLAGVTLAFQQVQAATITVNSAADDETAQDSKCTLREALDNVNAADDFTDGDCTAGTGTGDTIVFNLPLPATITLTMGIELEIDTDVTINGPTTGVLTLDGDGQAGVLIITAGTVNIANLTIQNGLGLAGGGIYNDGTLTLTNCTLRGNSADDGSGIYNDFDGTAVLDNCTLTANSAGDGDGGGVYNDGAVILTNCTLSGNSASDGGGVYNDIDGMAVLTDCTLSGNAAANAVGGGGVYNDGTLTLTGCTLSGNSGDSGGGVYNDIDGTAALANCTLSGNSATGSDFGGGGVYNDGTVRLGNCTLSGNSASDGGGVYNDVDGTATLTNTIVANSPSGQNCNGTDFGGAGHNLSSDATCFSSPDMVNTNPRLAPLANYGGPTATLALCTAPGIPAASCTEPSPAIDAGDDAVNLTTDQRGLPRLAGLHVDIGAYEAQPTTTPMCLGDCDSSGDVTVDELITMVNIDLGNTPLAACTAGDADGSGTIEINEIIGAVSNALNACPAG